MTAQQKQALIQFLAQQFDENYGNRVTKAVAHGIMVAVDQFLTQSTEEQSGE